MKKAKKNNSGKQGKGNGGLPSHAELTTALKAVVNMGAVGPLISGPGISHIRATPSAALVATVWLLPRKPAVR